jgi:hypothetical protein
MNPKHKMGKPCMHGHGGLRWRSDGTCVECSRERTRARRAAERARRPVKRRSSKAAEAAQP